MTEPSLPRLSDLAIVNARVFTSDARRPWADAVFVRDGRIEALGSSAEIRKRAGDGTRVVDAKRLMMTRARDESSAEAAALGAGPLGALAAGAPANLLLLDRDISSVPPELRGDACVVLLVMGGRIVFDRDGLAP